MKMCDVFISYRRSDGEEVAKALCNYLQEGGLRVFLDTSEELGIEIGSAFPDQLKQAIEMAAHYVLIASPDAVKERTGEDWVFEEINTAYDLFKNSNGKTTDRSFSILKTDENVVLPKKLEKLHFLCVGETEDKKSEAFKAIFDLATKVDKRNLWYAAHRWLEKATGNRGRFASLNISETIMPNVNNEGINASLPINVSAKDTENPSQESLLEALEKSKSNIMLVGEGGAGKTTALVHIMKKAYEKEYTNDSQVPIFVDLSYAPDTNGNFYSSGRPSFIRRSIYRQLCQGRLDEVNKNELEYINRIFSKIPENMISSITSLLSDKKEDVEPEYLLLLDGLNEVSTTKIRDLGESAMQMVLREIEYLIKDCPNVRLVITSRSQTNDLENTQELMLCGVNDDAIIQYLEEVGTNEKAHSVMNNAQLKEVLKNPFFLTLYASGDVAGDALAAGEILHSFFTVRQQKLNADIEYNMGRESGHNQNRFTQEMKNFILDFIIPEIAWTMEKENKFKLYKNEAKTIIERLFNKDDESEILSEFANDIFFYKNKSIGEIVEEFSDKYSKIGSLTSAILDCCVNALGVLQFERPSYSFIHQHIRDYFAAQKNINELRLAAYLANERGKFNEALNSLVEFNKEPVNIDVRRFMGEALGEHRNKPYLSDGIWHSNVPKNNCDRNLIKRALNAYRKKFDGECGYGIYSLITILKEIRKDLSGEDFSYLDMKYCNLNGTVLGRPFLSAKFDGALVNDYTFMPWGKTVAQQGMAISPDKKLVATVDNDAVVRVWNIKPFSLIKGIKISIDQSYITDFMVYWLIDIKFDENGENIQLAIDYYRHELGTAASYIKSDVFLISMDSFEIKEIDAFSYDHTETFSAFCSYENGMQDDFWFYTEECVNLDTYANLIDLKKAPNGNNFKSYQEYTHIEKGLSLCRFPDGLVLYDFLSGALINKYYSDFGYNDFKVICNKNDFVVICGNKIILFDYDLNFIAEKILEDSVSVIKTVISEEYISLALSDGEIIILSSATLDKLNVIPSSSEDIPISLCFTKDGNIIFFNTSNNIGFVYNLSKNSVIDFVEAFSYGSEENLFVLENIFNYKVRYLENDIRYIGFSKTSPEELLTVTGYRSLNQKNEISEHNNRLRLSVEDIGEFGDCVVLRDNGMEQLGVIDNLDINHFFKPTAIFSYDNKKIVVSDSDSSIAFIDVNDLLKKKYVSFDSLSKIDIPNIGACLWWNSIYACPDNTIATTHQDAIRFWDLDKKALSKQIEHTSGLYIIDVNLNKLHPQSELSEDTKQKLRQYGAKV